MLRGYKGTASLVLIRETLGALIMEKSSLTNLGLTDGESKVYLALLKRGSSTVGPIVKEAKVAYSNIYEILDRLLEKGLVSFIIKEKTRYFQAAPPSQLKEYIEKKEFQLEQEKLTLKRLVPELENLQQSTQQQQAEIFLGLKGMKTAFERMVQEYQETKKEYLFFYIAEEGFEQSDEFFSRIYPKFRHIPAKGIANIKYKQSKFIRNTHFKVKYANFPIPSNIDILNDKVLLTSWQQPLAILITSKDIAEKFSNYFYSIWSPKDYSDVFGIIKDKIKKTPQQLKEETRKEW